MTRHSFPSHPPRFLVQHSVAVAKVLCPIVILSCSAIAQTAASPESTDNGDQTVKLDEFSVVSAKDRTYQATNAAAGSRLGTAIRDIPQSITVLTPEFLKDINAATVLDALFYVSGVVNTTEGQPNGGDGVYIRGQTSPFPFRDGVRDEALNTTGEMADVDRVEVLKGPSGFLYGNTFGFGGVINKVSVRPMPQSAYSLSTTLGTYYDGSPFYERAVLDATGPITDDKSLLYRMTYAIQNGQTYRDFIRNKRQFFAPKLSYQLGANTDIAVNLEYLKTEVTNDPLFPVVSKGTIPLIVKPTLFLGEPWAVNHVRLRDIRTTIDQRIGSHWTYRQTALAKISDADKPIVQNLTQETVALGNINQQVTRQVIHAEFFLFQGDLVGRFTTGPFNHRVLVGYEIDRDIRPTTQFIATMAPINIYNPVYTNPTSAYTLNLNQSTATDVIGYYFNDQISLLKDRVQVVGGVRIDNTEQTVADYLHNTNTDFSSPQSITPRVGLIVRPLENVSVYATYAKGFLPDTSGRVVVPNLTPVQPQEADIKETGIKSDWLQGRLSVTGSIFRIYTKNAIYTAPAGSPPNAVLQTGATETEGSEVDVTAEPVKNLTVIASYAYTDGWTAVGSSTIPVGTPLENTPRQVGQIWARYQFDQGVLKGVGVRYDLRRSSKLRGRTNAVLTLPGYTLMDAGLSYRVSARLSMSLNVTNLANAYYYPAAAAATAVPIGAPRGYQFNTTVSF